MVESLNNDTTVTKWIARLKSGDGEAAERLWHKYFDQLVRLAKKRLGTSPGRVVDEEDVALSVFKRLCIGARKGHFTQLTDRADLWCLLMAITRQKATDQLRWLNRKKRGEGKVRGDSIFFPAGDEGQPAGFDELVGDDPTPDFLAELNEENERLLGLLRDDTLRRVAIWRMEGHSNKEIAEKLDVAPGTVERKLRLIRSKWERELE